MRRIQRLCLLILFYSIPFIVAFTSNTPRGGGGDAAAAASVATGTARVAPLVDSALLRFVSAEKKKQQRIEDRLEQVSLESIYSSKATNREKPLRTSRNSNTMSDQDMAASVPSVAGMEQLEDPWMGQYNRNRISRTLESLGVDEAMASRAGEKVQDYVLVRLARRRVQAFLRERDSLWREPAVSTNSALKLIESNSSILSTEPLHPSYGFDDVVQVMRDYGLTGTDICTILMHSPSLALMMPNKSFADEIEPLSGGTLDQTLRRSLDEMLMSTLGLRKYDARKVLRSCPGILTNKGSKSALQVVAIMTKLGVSSSAIARDKKALPMLLSRSPAELFRLISFLSSGSLRMPIEMIGPLIRRKASFELLDLVAPAPKFVHLDKDNVNDELNAMESDIEAALQRRSRKERKNQIDALYKNMTLVAETLRNEIGASNLGDLIAAYPSLLLLDAENKVMPTAIFLIDELGISRGELASVLQQYPLLLGQDVTEMEKKVAFLSYLGVSDADVGRIFRSFPMLFTLDIKKDMIPVVEYLRSIGVDDVGAFVTKLPAVLGYSVEKELRPKWEFLNKVCFRPHFEIRRFPAYFSYPLDRVIKTRYDYLAAKGIQRHLIPLDKVVRHGDLEFAMFVARDEDEGKVFRAFNERRKRSIQQKNKIRKRKPKSKLAPKENSV